MVGLDEAGLVTFGVDPAGIDMLVIWHRITAIELDLHD